MPKDRHPAHPPSASAPGVRGFQRSLQPPASVRTVGSAAPPPLCPGSSNTVMPSRQLCRGSCLNHLKADGWAGTRCRPPGSEEAALLLRPGHRLSQMDSLSQHPRTGFGSGQAPPAEAGQASVGLLSKGPGATLPFPQERRAPPSDGHGNPSSAKSLTPPSGRYESLASVPPTAPAPLNSCPT